MDTQVSYLVNIKCPILVPEDKCKINYDHNNYRLFTSSPEQMISNHCDGYQIVTGRFERKGLKIRTKECLKEYQVFIVEIDDNVKEKSLQEVLDSQPFTRKNALALTESVRSKYDDPNDDTCNGELRYRIWFMMPRPSDKINEIEWVKNRILEEYPQACKSGSSMTNGAIGRKGIDSIFLGQTLSDETLKVFRKDWKKYLSRPKFTFNPSNYKSLPRWIEDIIHGLSFNSEGWSTTKVACLSTSHRHDNIRPGTSVKENSDGTVCFYCHKCKESKLFKLEAI